MIETWCAELPHGIRLSCRGAGARGRPVLVFLHGFPEAAFVWDGLLAHFAQPAHGSFRCVAPNLRGYEDSSQPPEAEAYRPRHLVQDIAALIAAETGGDGQLAALVGHDWGGALAWNLAAGHPGLLRRLVIVNAPHPQPFARELQHNPAQQAASSYIDFLVRPDAEALLAERDFARLWPFFGATGTRGPAWLTDDLRARYRAAWAGDGQRPGAGLTGPLNYYRASSLRPSLAGAPAGGALALPPTAFTVTTPTLVLWGMQDAALPPSLLDDLPRWVPQLALERNEHATHWIVHEQPAWVAAHIARFVAS